MVSGISQSFGLDLVNINVYANFHKNVPLDRASFTFSEFRLRQSLDHWQMVFGKLFGLQHLVNMNVYAKFYQNIHTFQE